MALTDNLVAYYKLNETTWTTAYDSVWTKNLALNWNITWTSWVIDNCASFNQNWNYMLWTTPMSSLVSFSNWFTFSCILKDVAAQSGSWTGAGIFKASWNTTSNQVKLFYGTSSQSWPDYKLYFEWLNWTPTTVVDNRTSIAWTWPLFIVLVITSTTLKLYQNWTLVHHQTWFSWNNTIATTWWLLIWWDNYDSISGRYLLWKIDEIGLWNRPLTSAEVTTLYNSWNWLTYPFTTTPAFKPYNIIF